jgi:hypothetical protein
MSGMTWEKANTLLVNGKILTMRARFGQNSALMSISAPQAVQNFVRLSNVN